jgi:predicted transport protein
MDQQLQTMINNMPEKTGKPLEEWIQILKVHSFEKHSEAVSFLKKEYSVTHGFANTIVHIAKTDHNTQEDLVGSQYLNKATLKPIYDKIVQIVSEFGNDVELAPKKAYVSLRRSKQFAIIQPSTKSRVDVGINLGGVEPTDRLLVSGSFNSMVSHRVKVSDLSDVDEELVKWLKTAYDQA